MSTQNNLDYLLINIATKIVNNPNNCIVVVAADDAQCYLLEKNLRSMLLSSVKNLEILIFPGFVQTGVFKFESARRVISHRLGTLFTLSQKLPQVVLTSAVGALRACPSLEWIKTQALCITVEQELEPETILEALKIRCYTKTERVEEMGEYTVRGGIVDFWTPGQAYPSRLEFFGETLEKIRQFRAADQRSFATINSVKILPAREFVWFNSNEIEPVLELFNKNLLGKGFTGYKRTEMLDAVRIQIAFPGIDDLCWYFSNSEVQNFFKFIDAVKYVQQAQVEIISAAPAEVFTKIVEEVQRLYHTSLQAHQQKFSIAPVFENVFPHAQGGLDIINNAGLSVIDDTSNLEVSKLSELFYKKRIAERIKILADLRDKQAFANLVIACKTQESFFSFAKIFIKYFPANIVMPENEIPLLDFSKINNGEPCGVALAQGVFVSLGLINEYFFLDQTKTLVISESFLEGISHDHSLEVYTDTQSQQASREASITLLAAQFGDFTDGDLVVHVQYGIAKFIGLVTVSVDNTAADFLVLEYAGGDKIYVPVNKMNLVQRYIGSAKDNDKILDSLKASQWEKKKVKALGDAEKLAKELMEHQARRATTPGHAFAAPDADYFDFEAAFLYDETIDQTKAIKEIMSDMSTSKAMDRLLVGDVGFGKTEVGMRAAFRAILDGKQVAWLCPTTILAHQHYRSLCERFSSFGVKTCLIDRSVSGKSSVQVLSDLLAGKYDMVIGTHRLLSKDILFKNLGLLVVDEEHRFGVLQKERIKHMSYGVDTLTMTATPIPRTLQMAMVGLRDLSLLTTPPKARLAVKTFVCPYDETIIKDAILAEFSRGGQVFFVHNRVEELASVGAYLQELLPEARIGIGHGQMGQKELDNTVIAFLDQKYNILLCTTIIESGVDMPNVNTIFVKNSDNFGLAQLYQLRGRVGRRASRGFCYYLLSDNAEKNAEGMQRLDILKEHQDLGSGFIVASHDLEMRGAGNILGDEQSGQVNEVGLETYTQMLDDAIKALGGVRIKALREVEILLPLSYQIPETYIPNAKERLKLYRRFFASNSDNAITELLVECEDRFGTYPPEVAILADIVRIRRGLVAINAVSITTTMQTTEIRINHEVFNSHDEIYEKFINKLLAISNKPNSKIRLTPDGRILLPIPQRSFTANYSKCLLDIKQFLALL